MRLRGLSFLAVFAGLAMGQQNVAPTDGEPVGPPAGGTFA